MMDETDIPTEPRAAVDALATHVNYPTLLAHG